MSLASCAQELRKYRNLVAVIFVFCMIATISFLATSNMDHSAARTLAGEFNPGNIISDAVMGNYNSMTKDEIQAFLTAHGNCNNTNHDLYLQIKAMYPKTDWHFENGKFVCLSEEVFGQGNTFGKGVPAGEGQTAAEIIYEAAQDYRINPQVLIVLLEKEQSLISDSYPNSVQYQSATGYGCPDTAACDTQYYGFRNQVRNAAAMFRSVLDGGWSNYPAGKTIYVQYNPSASCGGSRIYIENRATSALYRYTPYQPNASALAAGYGTGDSCSAYGNRNFYLYFTDWFGSTQSSDGANSITGPAVQNDYKFEYQSYVEKTGWQTAREGGNISGTTGQSAHLEAFKLNLGKDNSNILYRSHIQSVGWESTWHKGGEASGVTGQNRALEAVQLQLTADLAKQYDIYYRVHVSYVGWMGWAKNGESAGTTGESHQIEAMQVAIIKKGTTVKLPSGNVDVAFRGSNPAVVVPNLSVSYQAHAAYLGWMDWVKDGQTAGTTGQSRQLEAISVKISSDNSPISSDIKCRAHAAYLGWMDWVKDGQTAGTTGQSRHIEAIEMKLPDDLAKYYSIEYRVHAAYLGWMDWVKDGQTAGTTGESRPIEAIEIRLVKK